VLTSSKGNIAATWVKTLSFALAGRTKPSTVTSTMNSGKIEKKAQKATIAARFVDLSSENFLNVATATLVGLVAFCAASSFPATPIGESYSPLRSAAATPAAAAAPRAPSTMPRLLASSYCGLTE